jgi:hypothetical protein
VSKFSTTIAWLLGAFEGNFNHLGAGAFEITPRRLSFERVAAAAAMSKAIFDMGFVMADVRM